MAYGLFWESSGSSTLLMEENIYEVEDVVTDVDAFGMLTKWTDYYSWWLPTAY